jgi:enamine deaminase RidA (YjgF/YER057c/UK114 family)
MLICGTIALAAVERLGGAASDVVRTRMFITDRAFADEVGRAHSEVFGAARPAATMIVVAGLLDPVWKVEIEVEAVVAEV